MSKTAWESVETTLQIVGREAELTVLHGFVRNERLRVLVLSGGPGIGKTTLWEAGVAAAREQGIRVLTTRASEAEARLAFSAVIDLLDGIDVTGLELPGPQCRALEVALLRAEPTGAPPEPQAVSLAFLNALRQLAAGGPLLIAIDDLQWLDPHSAEALAFAARRLQGERVGFLLARRPGDVLLFERELGRRDLEQLDVGPLSLGAIRGLLAERFGLSLPRWVLRRIFEVSAGNPLFAHELGRTLVERGLPTIGDDLPVPEAVEDLHGLRVVALPLPLRRLLLALALGGDLRATQLAAVAGQSTLDEAVGVEIVRVDGDRVRASHPLLAAAARDRADEHERRELHRVLAEVVADPELRARHLALAATAPDAELAATATAAAAASSARGTRQDAVELAEHGLRLTARESPERAERVLALAWYLEAAGERQRVTDLLEPELTSLPPGDARVRALLFLSEGVGIATNYDHERYLEQALAESGDDPVLRARVLAKMAINATACCARQVPDAEAWTLEALPAAPRAGVDVERLALHGLAWARCLSGRPADDVWDRFCTVSDSPFHITDSPEQVLGCRLAWRGETESARAHHAELLSLADERGEAVSYALQRMNLCDLELRAGEWDAATRLLDEWAAAPARLLIAATYERSRALLAAGRGFPVEAAELASSALADAEPRGFVWQTLEARRALGIAALLAGDPRSAAEALGAVWEHTLREGVDDPGVFPVAPDLVEALLEIGELEEARTVAGRLRELSEAQEHPWGLTGARRCSSLVRLADGGYDDEAAALLAQAADEYERLGFRFDRPRSLLSLGRAQRRLRKWGAARKSLEQAAAAFDEIGSPGWAEVARSELARVGGRQPREAGELTEAEGRVVELAAGGLSNKEIAQALVVTVPTVQTHLSHAYAKLGVRSRAQLARRLSADA